MNEGVILIEVSQNQHLHVFLALHQWLPLSVFSDEHNAWLAHTPLLLRHRYWPWHRGDCWVVIDTRSHDLLDYGHMTTIIVTWYRSYELNIMWKVVTSKNLYTNQDFKIVYKNWLLCMNALWNSLLFKFFCNPLVPLRSVIEVFYSKCN